MRVIAGEFRSRVLTAPKGSDTRPTSDRLRETLFNILAPRVAGSTLLDLYAGSGAVGIEALSRGAAQTIFIENAASAQRAIRANLASLGIRDNYSLSTNSVSTALKRLASENKTADIVFLDPPYDATDEYESTLNLLGVECYPLLAPGALVIAEHLKKLPLAETYGSLTRTRTLKQGDSILSFYASSPSIT